MSPCQSLSFGGLRGRLGRLFRLEDLQCVALVIQSGSIKALGFRDTLYLTTLVTYVYLPYLVNNSWISFSVTVYDKFLKNILPDSAMLSSFFTCSSWFFHFFFLGSIVSSDFSSCPLYSNTNTLLPAEVRFKLVSMLHAKIYTHL